MLSLGNFLNSAISKNTQQSLPGAPTTIAGAFSNIGGLINTLSPLSKKSSVSAGQTAALGLMDTGFKAAENIPGVGAFIKAGNIANSLMPDFLAGQSKADQFVNKVPGLKVLNFSVGKSKDFSLDPTVSASGYKGTASQLQDTKDNYAGINQGALTSLFGGKKSANKKVEAAKLKQNRVSNVLEKGQNALDAQASMAQDLNIQNKLKFSGGFNPVAVGKNGLKLTKKDKILAKSTLKKFKKGGKIEMSIIPGGALHAHKHHLEDHSEEIANAVTDKGVPVVTFEEGGAINQHAEIERGEIIFRLEIAKKLEELWEDGSEDAMIKAGKLIADEILNNTKDNSEEYEIND